MNSHSTKTLYETTNVLLRPVSAYNIITSIEVIHCFRQGTLSRHLMHLNALNRSVHTGVPMSHIQPSPGLYARTVSRQSSALDSVTCDGCCPLSWSQWSSGNTLACGARGPRFASRCRQKFVFSRKSLRYAALGTGCTLTAVPRSTQPSTLRGTVNEYQPYG